MSQAIRRPRRCHRAVTPRTMEIIANSLPGAARLPILTTRRHYQAAINLCRAQTCNLPTGNNAQHRTTISRLLVWYSYCWPPAARTTR